MFRVLVLVLCTFMYEAGLVRGCVKVVLLCAHDFPFCYTTHEDLLELNGHTALQGAVYF